MGGRLVFPVGGYCHASKCAVEALTDASCPYPGLNAADEQMAASYRSTLLTAPPEASAAVIERAILSARPRPAT